MADPLFKATILPQTMDPLEAQKSALDLLKKVNDVHALSAAGQDGLQASIDALTAALSASLPVSGSNVNDNWLKLYDGTLIQQSSAIKTITAGGYIESITFPIPFVGSIPAIMPSQSNLDSTGGSVLINGTPTLTGFVWRNAGATITASAYRMWIAIGKWK